MDLKKLFTLVFGIILIVMIAMFGLLIPIATFFSFLFHFLRLRGTIKNEDIATLAIVFGTISVALISALVICLLRLLNIPLLNDEKIVNHV